MSKSTSEDCRISIDEDEKTSHVDANNPHNGKKINNPHNGKKISNPHYGKKIDKVVFSPNMDYVATASFNDHSVCMWEFTNGEKGELELIPYYSFNLIETVLGDPICISNSDTILTGNFIKGSYIYETRDCNSEDAEKLLDGRDHENALVTCGFLTDGKFAVVEREPYQVHIYSKVGGKWYGTSDVKLVKFQHAVISQDRVLILIDLPFVIMQWNLRTQKFEKQYELDWSLAEYRK
ncbi:369_t:CDS:2, partial [Acaulospora morrowiae]